jgi:hypothetical protein
MTVASFGRRPETISQGRREPRGRRGEPVRHVFRSFLVQTNKYILPALDFVFLNLGFIDMIKSLLTILALTVLLVASTTGAEAYWYYHHWHYWHHPYWHHHYYWHRWHYWHPWHRWYYWHPWHRYYWW